MKKKTKTLNTNKSMFRRWWQSIRETAGLRSVPQPAHTATHLERGHLGKAAADIKPPSTKTRNQLQGHQIAFGMVASVMFLFLLITLSGAHQTATEIVQAITLKVTDSSAPPEGFLSWVGKVGSPARIAEMCKRINIVAEAQMFNTILLICVAYVVLQTLCIPGTVILNALIGTLVGVAVGVPLAVSLGTLGACCCFLLSSVAGTRFVESVDRTLLGGSGLPRIRHAVQKYKDELFVYLLFLRLTPVLPNWLVNLASPVVDVPMLPFAAATCFGITPQTYLAVRFGNLVSQLSAASNVEGASIVTPMDTALLVLVAITVVVVHRLRKRFGKDEPAGKVE